MSGPSKLSGHIKMKRTCNKISAMQEACLWYWQDDTIEEQVWYYNLLMEMDFLAKTILVALLIFCLIIEEILCIIPL